MTARDRQRTGRSQDVRDLCPVPLHGLAVGDRRRRLELPVELVDHSEVPGVDGPYGADPVGQGGVGDVLAHGPALHGVHGVERALEAHRVDARELVHRVALRQRLGGEVRVRLEHVSETAVEPEIAAAAVHHLVELRVVALAVLPACGDGSDTAVAPERADDGPRGGQESLGPEEDRRHPACTCTVLPTSSSIARRVS